MEEQLNDDHKQDMLTTQEVCEKLHVSAWTVKQLIRTGQLMSVKIGARRLIPRHALQDYTEQLEKNGRG